MERSSQFYQKNKSFLFNLKQQSASDTLTGHVVCVCMCDPMELSQQVTWSGCVCVCVCVCVCYQKNKSFSDKPDAAERI